MTAITNQYIGGGLLNPRSRVTHTAGSSSGIVRPEPTVIHVPSFQSLTHGDGFYHYAGSREHLEGFVKRDYAGRSLDGYQIFFEGLGYSRLPDGTSSGSMIFRNLHYDGTHNFVMCYNGEPIARIGFKIADGTVTAFPQGVRGKKRFLKPLKWERALLMLVYRWVAENGFSQVRVPSSKKVLWMTVRNNENGNAHMIYDVTARRCGFKLAEDGFYYRGVS